MTEKPVTRQDAVLSMLASRSQPASKADNTFSILAGRIREYGFIPFISNSLRLEHIFAQLIQALTSVEGNEDAINQSIEQILAKIWAQQIGYPLSDSYNMARVAQYHIVETKYDRKLDVAEAKKEYLIFQKTVLLNFAQNILGADEETIQELTSGLDELTFTDIVRELELPKFAADHTDPLKILAMLPIPIYVTTSPHMFVERALEAAGKHPCTQVCLWSGNVPNLAPEHRMDEDYRPEVASPLVYHLYGLEKYNTTLVLSEDDYLDFLVRITQDTDSTHPLIPLPLRSALAVSSLVLLGYRLQDWDCRVLLRGLMNANQANRPKSIILQLSPGKQEKIVDDTEASKYLEFYFKSVSFDVEWTDPEVFLNRLWAEWNKRR